ncbi:MAG: hypothetical protein E7096_05260 [Bacteroides sp.]|nr:hypothetical protein [Bacteroides sp.]
MAGNVFLLSLPIIFLDKVMKTFRIFILLLVGILLYSCDSQSIPSKLPGTMSNIRSRGIIKDSSLPIGSKALFNLSGDMTLINKIITFDGTSWGIDEELTISDHASENLLTVLCPAYNDENNLITQNPYIENALEDVLIAQKTWSGQTNIELEFSHLFAMLTIHVETSLNASLTDIAVEAPKVTSIKGNNGSFETSDNQTHTTTLDKNTTGEYSFIIPSIDNCPLTLIFNFGEEQTSHTLTHDFKSGFKYECNVIDEDTRPGIRTAKELIAFSYLINGKEPPKDYQGYTLKDFGETVNERTVYRLLADITFTEELSYDLLPIGYSEAKAFQHIFDGEGHTISNLIIPDKSINTQITKDFSGLFGGISSDGIVKNLHIINTNTITNPISTPTGGIVAKNYGLIDNCSVQSSQFYSVERTGGICGFVSSTGYITNCYTANNKFHIKKSSSNGGIVGDIAGHILNCYAYNNTYNITSTSYNGGIAGQSNKGQIHNCYLFQENNPEYFGAALGKNGGITMTHFLYNGSDYIVYNTLQETSKNAQIYDANFNVNEKHISTLLNDWVNQQNTEPKTYPDFTFRTWTSIDNNSPAIFQQ